MHDYDYLLKLLIIGNSGVGKSSILMRFADDDFVDDYIYTIGVDFKIRSLMIDGKKLKLQIWDTAGQERFRSMTSSYFRGAHGVIVVYDVTDSNSFDSIKNWLNDIIEHSNNDHIVKILVGNKCDMTKRRVVPHHIGKQLAQEIGMSFVEASAKTGDNIEVIFETITLQVLVNILEGYSGDGQPKQSLRNHYNNTVALIDKPNRSQCCHI